VIRIYNDIALCMYIHVYLAYVGPKCATQVLKVKPKCFDCPQEAGLSMS